MTVNSYYDSTFIQIAVPGNELETLLENTALRLLKRVKELQFAHDMHFHSSFLHLGMIKM